jgi:multimeric flavodoxin WrbA
MKVVAFDGSARTGGSITGLLERVAAELRAQGIETELLRLEKNEHTGCCGCGECAHKRDLSCHRPPEDGLRRCVRKVIAADGVIIGSPAYSARCSPAAQSLMVHASQAGRAGDAHPLACKVAAAVVDVRSAGSGGTRRALTDWFRAHEMIVVRANRPGGAAAGDGGGAEAMADLGRTMAWMLRRLRG